MRVMLATICLNEMEWLPKLFQQHKDWPGLVGWCFVEGADPIFRQANPTLVSSEGLSVDGTTELIAEFTKHKGVIGIHCHSVPAAGDQGKCYLRNQYLHHADLIKPDIIIQLDADEFYTKHGQTLVNHVISRTVDRNVTAWMFQQRHIWRPPSSQNDAGPFSQEVVGGYWQVPHTRVWRYLPGMSHVRNHNWPEVDGRYLTSIMMRCDLMDQSNMPQCTHLGYASSVVNREAKAAYYVARGEGSEEGRIGRKRRSYLECRAAHLAWQPGAELPHGAKVIPYTGPIPECFQ